ncbi:MAG: fimbrillin family protein [Prevotella sp.]|nr:fimbrillin family protein [Prevotella sp.]
MKKNLFLISVAALAFAACSNDTTVEQNTTMNQPKEIAISAFNQKATRGANAILNGTFPTDNTMEVACYQSAPTGASYFSKITFSFIDDDDDVWHASTRKYWPLSPATLNFYAVSGFGVDAADITIDNDLATAKVNYRKYDAGRTDGKTNPTGTTYANTTQSDIMYAFNRGAVTQDASSALSFNNGTTVSTSKVSMVFKHALSQIDFQVKAADATTANAITINSITLTGASYTGELTLTNGANVTAVSGDVTPTITWDADAAENRTVPNVPTSIIYSAGNATDYRPAAPSTACLMIIPNATSAFTSFTINYTLDGKSYDYTYTPASTVAAAGYKYTYQINFRLHEITINPSVTPWTESSSEINVQ